MTRTSSPACCQTQSICLNHHCHTGHSRRGERMAHNIGMLLALASTTNALSVLVVGVSGGTGQRAFRGLVAGGLDAPKISFLTRNPERPAAQALSALGATPVVADLDDAASLARAVSDATYDGVYVHGLAGDEKRIDTEEAPPPRGSRRRCGASTRRPSSSTTRRRRTTTRVSRASSRSTPSSARSRARCLGRRCSARTSSWLSLIHI